MGVKLYITGIPFYLTENKLRPLLDDYHVQSLCLVQTIHGDVAVVELESVEDAQMLTSTLSHSSVFTLEGACKLSAVQADSSEGKRLERFINRLTDQKR